MPTWQIAWPFGPFAKVGRVLAEHSGGVRNVPASSLSTCIHVRNTTTSVGRGCGAAGGERGRRPAGVVVRCFLCQRRLLVWGATAYNAQSGLHAAGEVIGRAQPVLSVSDLAVFLGALSGGVYSNSQDLQRAE